MQFNNNLMADCIMHTPQCNSENTVEVNRVKILWYSLLRTSMGVVYAHIYVYTWFAHAAASLLQT